MHVYQGALLFSHLKYLNEALSLQIYKKYNWQHAGAMLAICTAYIEERHAGPRALLHPLCHYALCAKIILANFNLVVSTLTAELPNLIPLQMFWE